MRKQAEGALTDLLQPQLVHYMYGGMYVLDGLHGLYAFDKFSCYYDPESFFPDHETNTDKYGLILSAIWDYNMIILFTPSLSFLRTLP